MTRTSVAILATVLTAGSLGWSSAARAADSVRIAQAGPAAPPRATAPKTAPAPPAQAGGDASLRQRVDQLEEQLVDMQVTIGTIETLARSGGGAPARTAGAGGASDAARLDGIETQIRALTAQLEQLAAEVRGRRGDVRPPADEGGSRLATIEPTSSQPIGGFGATTVTPSGGDLIGSIIKGAHPGADPSSRVAAAPLAPAGVGTSSDPKQLYETAYGYLLQQDYGAAESAFDEFLQKFPSDRLAGNAQYWLGETHFVRGDYKTAAGAFLKGYQTYGDSAKAPDSLLKLALSLDRLGQKDAACSSFSEFNMRFPTAPAQLKTRAQSERRRVGCP
ncbi:MAG: tol-pal system protein YbgF [Pseudomonadota bacterium]